MNEQLFDFVNGLAGNSSLVDRVAVFFSEQGIYVLAPLLGAFGLAQLRREPSRALRAGVAAAMAVALALVVVFVCGLVIQEARPFVHDGDTVLLVKHARDNSFPSDHTTVAAAAAMVAALAWPKAGCVFLGLTAVIGTARVFVGVHYPGDVLAGFAIGSLAALAAWELATRRPDRWLGARLVRSRAAEPG
jgi:undecaprenyl-diphosphatase